MSGPGYPAAGLGHPAAPSYGFEQLQQGPGGYGGYAAAPYAVDPYTSQPPPNYAVGGVNLAEQLNHLSLYQHQHQQQTYQHPPPYSNGGAAFAVAGGLQLDAAARHEARVATPREDEGVEEGKSYLDHYGQDLRHMPKWRLIEMLRLSQEQCEQLENENQQLQACVEANRREHDDVLPPVPDLGHHHDRDRAGDEQPPPPLPQSSEDESPQELGFEVTLPSTEEEQVVQLAYPEGVQALVRELEQADAGEACASCIADDGFRALTYLTRRLAALHEEQLSRPTLVDEYGREYEEELQEGELSNAERRDMQVQSMRAMLLVGQRHPTVFALLAQSLASWLTPDLAVRDDPERLFYDLTILSKMCSQPSPLPPAAKAQLTEDLVDQVVAIIRYEADDMEANALKAIHDAALMALNPVVARLAAINGQDLGDLGQTFIIAFNREVREVIPPLVKLLRDLFSNPVTAKDFFFVNDLKVLVEIIMREITDTSDTKLAGMYLEVLHFLLTNSEYPQHIHRQSEIASFLLGLIKVEDDQTLGPLALKASAIIEDCPFLQRS